MRYGDEQKWVEISTELKGNSICISVFNTGRVIPEDKLPHLWDGFYKADDARTRQNDGYGLGLSIVKAIQTTAGMGYGAKNMQGGVVFWFDVARYKEKTEPDQNID